MSASSKSKSGAHELRKIVEPRSKRLNIGRCALCSVGYEWSVNANGINVYNYRDLPTKSSAVDDFLKFADAVSLLAKQMRKETR